MLHERGRTVACMGFEFPRSVGSSPVEWEGVQAMIEFLPLFANQAKDPVAPISCVDDPARALLTIYPKEKLIREVC